MNCPPAYRGGLKGFAVYRVIARHRKSRLWLQSGFLVFSSYAAGASSAHRVILRSSRVVDGNTDGARSVKSGGCWGKRWCRLRHAWLQCVGCCIERSRPWVQATLADIPAPVVMRRLHVSHQMAYGLRDLSPLSSLPTLRSLDLVTYCANIDNRSFRCAQPHRSLLPLPPAHCLVMHLARIVCHRHERTVIVDGLRLLLETLKPENDLPHALQHMLSLCGMHSSGAAGISIGSRPCCTSWTPLSAFCVHDACRA